MNTREKLFLVWAMTATAMLIVGIIILFQMIQPRLQSTIRLGGTAEFPVGTRVLFECNRSAGRCQAIGTAAPLAMDMRFHDTQRIDYETVWVWVTRDTADSLRALIAVSTHRGCFVNWDQARNRFAEGCYGSKWDREGNYIEGPAPRDLDSFPVRIENGDVMIDFNLQRGANHN